MTIKALDRVSLTVPAGNILGVMGKSGAGKSTLLRCINALERPTRGEVLVFGQNIHQLPNREVRRIRKKIGCVFQGFQLLSSCSVFENVAFPLKIDGWSDADIRQRVDELLDYVELSERRDSYPSSLSGGQKQRVAIARAIANRPRILLCDEPTSALDPITTRRILQLLRQLQASMGLTIVMISHEVQSISSICDDVVVLENGMLVESGKKQTYFPSSVEAV